MSDRERSVYIRVKTDAQDKKLLEQMRSQGVEMEVVSVRYVQSWKNQETTMKSKIYKIL